MSEERILEEIYDLKKLIHDTYMMEQDIKKEEDAIEVKEKDIQQKQDLLIEGLTILRYATIQAWKKMVWDHCSSREKKEQANGEVHYNCTLLNGPCRFEQCPKNVKK